MGAPENGKAPGVVTGGFLARDDRHDRDQTSASSLSGSVSVLAGHSIDSANEVDLSEAMEDIKHFHLTGRRRRPSASSDGAKVDFSRLMAHIANEKPSRLPSAPVAPPDIGGDYQKRVIAYVEKMVAAMAATIEGSRNHDQNAGAYVAFRLALGAGLPLDWVDSVIYQAQEANGQVSDDGDRQVLNTMQSARRSAENDGPEYLPDRPLDAEPLGSTDFDPPKCDVTDSDGGKVSGHRRTLTLTPAAEINDDIPTWVWENGDHGRMLAHSLTLFAGRPGCGKSTAARWFAAGFTNGTIPGCWVGRPQNIAYLAAEESVEHMVKPSLRAAGADLGRVFFPTVTVGGDGVDRHVAVSAVGDEVELTKALIAANIKVVVVDPVMSTIGGKTDVHRSNETRAVLDPWLRIAQAIGGVVIGIVHFRKDVGGDALSAIAGSSAFGEITRCAFGFAADRDSGERVMSQIKNSAGRDDLSMNYQLVETTVTVDSGRTTDMVRYVPGDVTGTRVEDVLAAASGAGPKVSKSDLAGEWVKGFLAGAGGSAESRVIKVAAKLDGHSSRTVSRVASNLCGMGERGGFQGGTTWTRLPWT